MTLFDNSILENIRLGRKDATDEEVLEAARLAHCDEFAEKLPDGWNTDIGENGLYTHMVQLQTGSQNWAI